MATVKQIEANKKNAIDSTGPISDVGKAIVSKNALRHGILSTEVVIPTQELDEKQEDYDALLGQLIEDYKPVGTTEEILVERIAIAYWRLRRVLRAEKGEIRKRADNAVFKKTAEMLNKADEYKEFESINSLTNRLLNSASAKNVKEQLEEIKKDVEHYGYIPKESFAKYARLMDLFKDETSFKWEMFFNELAQGKVENEDKEKGKNALLFTLDKHIERATLSIDVAKELEDSDNQSAVLSSAIPGAEVIEKLLRYETMLENQFYRAINQLLKLQVSRRGGKVVSIKSTELEGIEA